MRRLTLAALLALLPTLALGAVIAKNEASLAQAKIWRVKITGYDPRDLLYGHYLNFRFSWNWKDARRSCSDAEDCALCFTAQEGTDVPLVSYEAQSQAASTCVSYVPVKSCARHSIYCPSDRFIPETTQRYLIPEDAGPDLERILRDQNHDVKLEVKITPSGQRIFGDLTVDSLPWRNYLRQHPDAGN